MLGTQFGTHGETFLLYLVKKNKVYYLRIRIPQDVKQYFPFPEIKRSLHTQLYKQANSLAKLFVADTERVLMMIRSNTLTYPQIYKIIDNLLAKKLSRYDDDAKKAQKKHDYEKVKNFAVAECELVINENKRILAENIYEDVLHEEAQKILENNEITAEKGSDGFNDFCKELARAKIIQHEVIKSRIYGEVHPYEYELKNRKKSNTLQEVIVAYVQIRSKTLKSRSLTKLSEKLSKIIECFEYETGEKEILLSSIDYPLTVKVAERLSKYPSYRNTKYGGKSLGEIYKLNGVGYPSYTTVDEEISLLSAFYRFAHTKYAGLDKNYAEGLSRSILGKSIVKESEIKDIFRPEDIQEILAGMLKLKIKFHLNPHRYLIPLIALYSGMRLNEICQLYIDDIKEIGGIWCFDNNVSQIGKSLKNFNSKRINPIHPHLITIGLISFVELQKKKGCTRLWEGVRHNSCDYYEKYGKHSHYFGKWFNETYKPHLTLSNAPKQTFHSFRHTFLDWFNQNVNIVDHWQAITALSGHLDEDDKKLFGIDPKTEARRRYSKELSVTKQYETLKLLSYGIDITPLIITF